MPERTLYLFDGYNLLHAGSFEDPRELRDVLASFVAMKGARGVLVFDGQGADESHGPLDVRYAEDADTLLERLAAEHRETESVVLVSSDLAVRGTSGQEVQKLSSQSFLGDLETASHSEGRRHEVRDQLDPATRDALERMRRGQVETLVPRIEAIATPRWFFANLVVVKLSQLATGGRMSIVELVGPAGDMPPLHLHRVDNEAWYVLDGEMTFFVADAPAVTVAAGDLAFGPKGVPHTYRVESGEGARWLAVCTPGEFERFVLAASRPAPRNELPPPAHPGDEEIATVTSLAAECGIDLLGPPGTLPGES